MLIEWIKYIGKIIFIPISDDLLTFKQINTWIQNDLSTTNIFLAIWIGSFVCFFLFYTIPRLFREFQFFQRILTKPYMLKAENLIQRRGNVAIAVSFFLPGVRRPIHYMAGLLAYPFQSYFLITLIGTWVYTFLWLIFLKIAFYLGWINRIIEWYEKYGWNLVVFGVLLVVCLLIWWFRVEIRLFIFSKRS